MQTRADRSDRADGAGVLRLFNVAAWLEVLAALEAEFDAILDETGSTTGQALGRPHKG
jgi:plasmid stabilization system protein ParE